ncbi:hypothetical protein JTE90_014489 [Oedothorax gibbosus]|uniref:rRNA processing protein EBP2 n=1 Tax=Oedothorax gibbosus TaxID=931172 RepID=A0AAV6VM33_9ARAC|nr:hypothetical protein JTE90_014489 [Oedothorax gibbosus]
MLYVYGDFNISSNAKMSDDSDASVDEGFAADVPSLSQQKRKIFPVNNKAGLLEKLNDYKLNLDWIEKVDITIDSSTLDDEPKGDKSNQTQPENDFKREMSFYNQALASVQKAFKRLKKRGIPTQRPDDYMAEMAKSDAHMVKVRKKLLNKQFVVERVEKVRAIREQKKQGKKIQREVIQQRKQEKKKMISALKSTKKGKMGADKLLQPNKPVNKGKKGKNREYRDSKYGYGGRKKGSKLNTAESSAEEKSSFKRNFKPKGGSLSRQKKSRRRR